MSTDEDLEKSDTAKTTMSDFKEISQFVTEVCEEIEKEAGSISADQRLYADYVCAVKEFKPWMDDSEKVANTALVKPGTMDDALALLAEIEVSFFLVFTYHEEKEIVYIVHL